MNKLRDYLFSYPRMRRPGIRQSLADYVNVSGNTVKAWQLGKRFPTVAHSVKIQEFTKGDVKWYEMHPEIHAQVNILLRVVATSPERVVDTTPSQRKQ